MGLRPPAGTRGVLAPFHLCRLWQYKQDTRIITSLEKKYIDIKFLSIRSYTVMSTLPPPAGGGSSGRGQVAGSASSLCRTR